jgi:hypothetical protein
MGSISFCGQNMDAANDIHKEVLPIWAAFLMGSISLWISFAASIFFAHKNA